MSFPLHFIGDIAAPHGALPVIEGPNIFEDGATIANLEGAVETREETARRGNGPKGVALYNSTDVLESLGGWRVRVASLANNHMMDVPALPSLTRRRLADAGIQTCGAGDTITEAAAPAMIQWDQTPTEPTTRPPRNRALFLAFGWETIECQAAGPTKPGVNPLRSDHVLKSIAATRRRDPHAWLVALMHWDYELERYPMPAHRQLAFAALDAGADAIIGHHPHCVQGLEFVGEKPIVYSLGNWFLPQGSAFGGRINYPAYALRQLAFSWNGDTGDMTCHWFDYKSEGHVIRHVGSEPALDSPRVRELTPFAGMSESDYVRWFRANRVKRRGLPIYRDYRQTLLNRLYDRWNAIRMVLIRRLRGG